MNIEMLLEEIINENLGTISEAAPAGMVERRTPSGARYYVRADSASSQNSRPAAQPQSQNSTSFRVQRKDIPQTGGFENMPKIIRNKDGTYHSEPKVKRKTEFSGFPKAENVHNSGNEHNGDSLTFQDAEDVALDLREVIEYMKKHKHQSTKNGPGVPFFKSREARELNHTYTPNQQRQMYKIGLNIENGLEGWRMGETPDPKTLIRLAHKVIGQGAAADRKDKADAEEAERTREYIRNNGPMWSVYTEGYSFFNY